MDFSLFCCPICQSSLLPFSDSLRCPSCGCDYPIHSGVPDFHPAPDPIIDLPNQTWLDPDIAAARDTIYSLSARSLQGMAACIQRIARDTFPGCRILEVSLGTGHFTRWLAEVCAPGTEIYAFDISQPMLDIARANIGEAPGVTLFRANSRDRLPFVEETFDILFLRLAPLGGPGVPNLQAARHLLKSGGWYYEAGYEAPEYATAWADWAAQSGFTQPELLEWTYSLQVTPGELTARRFEYERLSSLSKKELPRLDERITRVGEEIFLLTREHLKIARKAITP